MQSLLFFDEELSLFFFSSFRGLSLSTQLYLNIFKSAESASYVTFDLLRHRVRHVIKSSLLLRVSDMILRKMKVGVRIENSYEVDTPNGVERFEKVTIRRAPVALVLKIGYLCRCYGNMILSFFVLFLSWFIYRCLFFL